MPPSAVGTLQVLGLSLQARVTQLGILNTEHTKHWRKCMAWFLTEEFVINEQAEVAEGADKIQD